MVQFKFKFSVVIAVYNVEEFIAEAIESILLQDIGFRENVQLILVDDGSEDKSGVICDNYSKKYPNNIFVIHKENGGVASARKIGLERAEGRYINFMDSDDKLAKNALSEVYKFFSIHENETDVVAIPMVRFGSFHGNHWLNYKFTAGSRVIDLFKDYKATLQSVSSSFFSFCCKEDIFFDTQLVCGEDVKAVLSVLYKKMKLGVVSTTKYLYRRRSDGESSLTQSEKNIYGWYFDFFHYFVDWVLDFYEEQFGFVPAYVQYLIVANLHWRISGNRDGSNILCDEEKELYKRQLFRVYKNIDDRYILEQSRLNLAQKNFILSKKYNALPSVIRSGDDFVIHFGETIVCRLSEFSSIRLEFLRYKDNVLNIEGFAKYFCSDIDEEVGVYALINNQKIICNLVQREQLNTICFGESIDKGVGFRVNIPIEFNSKTYKIKFGLTFRGVDFFPKNFGLGKFFPVVRNPVNSYYYCDGLLITAKSTSLKLIRCNKFDAIKQELSLLRELLQSKKKTIRKTAVLRCLYHITKPFYKKEIWLISDRINRADDSGKALFEYINGNKLPVNTYFVLREDSPEYPNIQKLGKVIAYNSRIHKLVHLLAGKIVSTAADDYVFNPYGVNEKYYRDILCGQERIFLQHGIIGNDLSRSLNRYSKNFSKFITSTKQEYDSIVNGGYYYDQSVVKLAGLARYDKLYNQEKKLISIMPTWRAYLGDSSAYHNDGRIRYNKSFLESQFFKFYDSLLNDSKLLESAKKNGYQIKFFPHPNVVNTVNWFAKNDLVTLCSLNDRYCDVFAESSLLVTDYSSVAFDFAYLRKPIVYCQFDKDGFFRDPAYNRGYFDEERDGFGEVEVSLEGTVDRIIEYMENGCVLKPIYRKRIDQFFTFDDKNNCLRNYEAIKSIGS